MIKLKSTNGKMPLFFKVAIAAQALFAVGIIWLVIAVVTEVKDKGLKNITNEIWCGENKDC